MMRYQAQQVPGNEIPVTNVGRCDLLFGNLLFVAGREARAMVMLAEHARWLVDYPASYVAVC